MADAPTLPTTVGELNRLVEEQVAEILRQRGGLPYTLDDADKLDALDAKVSGILADKSASRILTGPLWLSGASIVDATVTADKLIVNSLEAITAAMGTLNVTGTITAAASYPALTGARIAINATEIAAYNSSDTKTYSQNIDGSGFIGVGSTKMSWSTTGVLTVPAAAIGSLTIADVGSGTFNSNFDAGTGRVRAGTSTQRVEITSAGLKAYDTGGTQTLFLSASNGSLDMVGTFTIRNATSGARVDISNVGLRAYNSGGTQTASFSSSDGSGYLGVSGGGFSWNSSGTVIIDGSLLVAGTVTAGKLNVTTLSAITANAGTITAGTISAGTITTGTLAADRISGGAVGGSFTLGSATISIPSGGKIEDADGSYWDSTGIVLRGTGSLGDSLVFNRSGFSASAGIQTAFASNLGQMRMEAFSAASSRSAALSLSATNVDGTVDATLITYKSGGGEGSSLSLFGDGYVRVRLGDAAGTNRFQIYDSGSVEVFGINSDGELVRPIANDSTAEGTYYGRIPIYINGNLRYISIRNA